MLKLLAAFGSIEDCSSGWVGTALAGNFEPLPAPEATENCSCGGVGKISPDTLDAANRDCAGDEPGDPETEGLDTPIASGVSEDSFGTEPGDAGA